MNSAEIILYEPHITEYGNVLYEVYRCELPDVRGKNGRRYWYYPVGTPREVVAQDLLDYYKRNDVIWQRRLPGLEYETPDDATPWKDKW